MSAEWLDIAAVEDLPPGQRLVVDVDGIEVAVFNVAGKYYAVEDRCSHDDAPLGDGAVLGEQIVCPRHGARFCLRSGAALSAPAYEPIAVFPVRVSNDRLELGREPNAP